MLASSGGERAELVGLVRSSALGLRLSRRPVGNGGRQQMSRRLRTLPHREERVMPSDRQPPRVPDVRDRRRGAPAPQAAPRRGVPPVRPVRLRRGRRRPHHRPRSRAARPLLGQPVRHELQADPRQGPDPRQPRGRGRRGRLAGQPGRVRHPLADPRRPARRRRRRARALGVRQGVVVARAGRSTRSPRTRARSTTTTRCSTTTPASCSTSRRASASPTRSATTRRPSCATTACSPSARRRSTRRRGGSSRWSAPARPSCWPRPPARRC